MASFRHKKVPTIGRSVVVQNASSIAVVIPMCSCFNTVFSYVWSKGPRG